MRFDKDAPFPDAVKSLPHVAFEVDDLQGHSKARKSWLNPTIPAQV
jgi:hypothetical protein